MNVAPINLNGDPLPWVTSVKHLGNILECSNTMKQDCSVKRGKFVGKINNLGQEFYFANPEARVKILNIHAPSFYGSGLWDLFGSNCEGFYTAWNRAIRQISTYHGQLTATGLSLHPQVMLYSRYVKFHKSLTSSKKPSDFSPG